MSLFDDDVPDALKPDRHRPPSTVDDSSFGALVGQRSRQYEEAATTAEREAAAWQRAAPEVRSLMDNVLNHLVQQNAPIHSVRVRKGRLQRQTLRGYKLRSSEMLLTDGRVWHGTISQFNELPYGRFQDYEREMGTRGSITLFGVSLIALMDGSVVNAISSDRNDPTVQLDARRAFADVVARYLHRS